MNAIISQGNSKPCFYPTDRYLTLTKSHEWFIPLAQQLIRWLNPPTIPGKTTKPRSIKTKWFWYHTVVHFLVSIRAYYRFNLNVSLNSMTYSLTANESITITST